MGSVAQLFILYFAITRSCVRKGQLQDNGLYILIRHILLLRTRAGDKWKEREDSAAKYRIGAT